MAVTTTLPAIGALPIAFIGLTNSVQVVSSRLTRICGWTMFNPSNAVVYIVFFDTTTIVTLGVTIPKFFMPLPTLQAANMLEGKHPIFMEFGCQIAAVTAPDGSSAPSSPVNVSLFVQ